MFKLKAEPTFWTKVGISVAGKEVPEEIDVEYRYLNRTGLKDFFTAVDGKKDVDALSEIIVNWKIPEVEYTRDNLEFLLEERPAAAQDLINKFRRELMESKQKN